MLLLRATVSKMCVPKITLLGAQKMIEENNELTNRDVAEEGFLEATKEEVKKEESLPFLKKETSSLSLKLEVYEGPLDLLLDLIKQNEVNIYDIPIVEITRQYIDHLDQMRQLNLEVAGEFLVMASTLLLIKSKMLLPDEMIDEEDEEGIDPRAELVRKLLEYQAYKEVAVELGTREAERNQIFSRQISDYYFEQVERPDDDDCSDISSNLFDLIQAFHKVLKMHAKDDLHEVFEEIISIEQKLEHIHNILSERKEVLFSQLFREGVSRNELIVTFLAILEIVRKKSIRFVQDKVFGDIRIIQDQGVPQTATSASDDVF